MPDVVQLVRRQALFSRIHAETGEGACLRNFVDEVSNAIVVELEVVVLQRGHAEDLLRIVGLFHFRADDIRRISSVVYKYLQAYLQAEEKEYEEDAEGNESDSKEEAATLRLFGDAATKPKGVRWTLGLNEF